MENRIDDLEKKVEKLELIINENLSNKNIENKKKKSLKEFLLEKNEEKNLKNDVQKTLAIGYYLENNGNMESFNVEDIRNGFFKAREKIPKNIPDKILLNIKKGHLMESDEKKDNLKSYVLTSLGESYVESNFKS